MTELLATLLNLSVLVFAVSSMLSVGLAYTLREILGPLRNVSGVLRVLLANFVLVPLLAYLVLQVFPLERPYAVGLMLVATAAGAPFLIKLTERSAGNLAISATLLVILLPATVVYMPLVVPLLVPEAEVSAWAIARPLVVTMLLPLAAGLLVRGQSQFWAARLQPVMGRASSVALVVLVAATLLLNLGGILGVFGTGAILAAAALVLGAFAAGFALGPNPESRDELGLASAQRNIAAATVVATQAVGDADVLVMVVVTSLVTLALLFPIASVLRRREARRAEALGARLVERRQ